ISIEPRGYEHPDLRSYDRKGKAQTCEHSHFHIGEEGFVKRRVNEMVVGLARERMGKGQCQKCVDVFGESKAEEKTGNQRKQGIDKPLAQLNKVLKERRLRGLDLLFIGRCRLRHDDVGCGWSS